MSARPTKHPNPPTRQLLSPKHSCPSTKHSSPPNTPAHQLSTYCPPTKHSHLPSPTKPSCSPVLCGAGWKPAADWQSANVFQSAKIFDENSCSRNPLIPHDRIARPPSAPPPSHWEANIHHLAFVRQPAGKSHLPPSDAGRPSLPGHGSSPRQCKCRPNLPPNSRNRRNGGRIDPLPSSHRLRPSPFRGNAKPRPHSGHSNRTCPEVHAFTEEVHRP